MRWMPYAEGEYMCPHLMRSVKDIFLTLTNQNLHYSTRIIRVGRISGEWKEPVKYLVFLSCRSCFETVRDTVRPEGRTVPDRLECIHKFPRKGRVRNPEDLDSSANRHNIVWTSEKRPSKAAKETYKIIGSKASYGTGLRRYAAIRCNMCYVDIRRAIPNPMSTGFRFRRQTAESVWNEAYEMAYRARHGPDKKVEYDAEASKSCKRTYLPYVIHRDELDGRFISAVCEPFGPDLEHSYKVRRCLECGSRYMAGNGLSICQLCQAMRASSEEYRIRTNRRLKTEKRPGDLPLSRQSRVPRPAPVLAPRDRDEKRQDGDRVEDLKQGEKDVIKEELMQEDAETRKSIVDDMGLSSREKKEYYRELGLGRGDIEDLEGLGKGDLEEED